MAPKILKFFLVVFDIYTQPWTKLQNEIQKFCFLEQATPKSIVLYERKDKNLNLVVPELICTELQKSIMASFCISNTRPSKVLNY